ncbi:hypothetical protein THOM_0654 [Trachipleistophora hominis]|uniref:Uncharacterized protein n=1 Tax=Trachipleistophora hominis TaxID=72359 RepID=L7K000_TRAHO|nr:hypothetical protein THOM_0654 [Trachipleistophora hominis]
MYAQVPSLDPRKIPFERMALTPYYDCFANDISAYNVVVLSI